MLVLAVLEYFQHHFSTRLQAEGAGLGLSMVKEFMVESVGLLDIKSELDVGTTIEPRFPLMATKGLA